MLVGKLQIGTIFVFVKLGFWPVILAFSMYFLTLFLMIRNQRGITSLLSNRLR